MYTGMLGLHSLLRWLLIVFLVINIIRVNVEASEEFDLTDRKWSLRLLITAHINLVIGIYLYFTDSLPKVLVEHFTMGDVMKIKSLRFWIIEHPTMMILAITLITISHVKSKKTGDPLKKHRMMSWLYIFALLAIIAGVPWPFRTDDIGRPWFRAMY
ncbi:MAG: cytochrome B [Deinococcales bacterium]|nr:cytochrome B [Chitinophagaceae bacterium]